MIFLKKPLSDVYERISPFDLSQILLQSYVDIRYKDNIICSVHSIIHIYLASFFSLNFVQAISPPEVY